MPQVKNNFLGSKMNKDLDYRLVPEGEYITAQNIQITKSEGSDVGVVQNVKGNSLAYNAAAFGGSYECIGSFFDDKENRIFLFVTDNTNHKIAVWNIGDASPAVIVSGSFLNFNKSKLITGINVIEDFLFWTDNVNQPRRINLSKAIGDNTFYDNDIKVNVAKYSPYLAPTMVMSYDNTVTSTYIEDKFVRFSYRFKYENDEYSQIAPFSQIAFKTENNTLTAQQIEDAYSQGILNNFINYINVVTLSIPLPTNSFTDYQITSVEVLMKDANSLAVRLVKNIELTSADDLETEVTYVYSSEIPVSTIPNDQVIRVSDNVPMKALAQEIVSNRLVYGNYTENINPINLDFSVAVSEKTTEIATQYPYHSVKQRRNYEIGVVLSDRYGRKSPVITSSTSSIYVPAKSSSFNASAWKGDSLKIEFDNLPQSFGDWYSYRVVIKQLEQEYYNVFLPGLANFNDKTYGTIFGDNINKIPRDSQSISFESEIAASKSSVYPKVINTSTYTANVENKDRTDIDRKSYNIVIPSGNSVYWSYWDAEDYVEETIAGSQTINVPAGSAVGGLTPTVEDVKVYVDGILCFPTTHYTKTGGSNISSITFVSGYTQPVGRKVTIFKKLRFSGTAGTAGQTIQALFYPEGTFAGGSATETGSSTITIYVYDGDGVTPLYPITDNVSYQVGSDAGLSKVTGIGTIDKFNDISEYFITNSESSAGRGFYKVDNNYLLGEFYGDIGVDIVGDQLKITGQMVDLAVVETKPFESVLDIYYETSTSGLLSDLSNNVAVEVSFFNTFILKGDTPPSSEPVWHIEESRIKGDFNASSIDIGVVAHLVDKDYRQITRESSMIHSGLYNARTGVNRINEFTYGDASTKSMDPQGGSIQKLFAEEDNLNVFQEEKVSWVAIDRDVIYTAEGNPQVTTSNKILGQVVPYSGRYGIGLNPESFAYYAGRKYFACANKGVILRLSRDGMTEISNYGMRSYFRDTLKTVTKMYGSWDIHNKVYTLSMFGPNTTISFDEEANGWVSFYTYVSTFAGSIDGRYYSTKAGDIWLHYSNNTRNSFYGGSSNPSIISTSVNAEPSLNKNFLTLGYEGTSGWSASSINTDLNGVYYTDTAYPIAEYDISNQDLLISAFKKQNSSYVANIINETSAKANEVIYGQTMSGVKGMYMVVDMYTSSTEYKELFTITSNFNINNY